MRRKVSLSRTVAVPLICTVLTGFVTISSLVAEAGSASGGGIPGPQCPPNSTPDFAYTCKVEYSHTIHDPKKRGLETADNAYATLISNVSLSDLTPDPSNGRISHDLTKQNKWDTGGDFKIDNELPGVHVFFSIPSTCATNNTNVITLQASVVQSQKSFSFSGKGDLTTGSDVNIESIITNTGAKEQVNLEVTCKKVNQAGI